MLCVCAFVTRRSMTAFVMQALSLHNPPCIHSQGIIIQSTLTETLSFSIQGLLRKNSWTRWHSLPKEWRRRNRSIGSRLRSLGVTAGGSSHIWSTSACILGRSVGLVFWVIRFDALGADTGRRDLLSIVSSTLIQVALLGDILPICTDVHTPVEKYWNITIKNKRSKLWLPTLLETTRFLACCTHSALPFAVWAQHRPKAPHWRWTRRNRCFRRRALARARARTTMIPHS